MRGLARPGPAPPPLGCSRGDLNADAADPVDSPPRRRDRRDRRDTGTHRRRRIDLEQCVGHESPCQAPSPEPAAHPPGPGHRQGPQLQAAHSGACPFGRRADRLANGGGEPRRCVRRHIPRGHRPLQLVLGIGEPATSGQRGAARPAEAPVCAGVHRLTPDRSSRRLTGTSAWPTAPAADASPRIAKTAGASPRGGSLESAAARRRESPPTERRTRRTGARSAGSRDRRRTRPVAPRSPERRPARD